MTEEEIKELSNELKEIEEVKMPLVMQKLEQGSLKENSLYEKAENEQKALDTRAREIKFILMREDCDKLVDSMQSVLDEVSLNKCLKNVKDFYKNTIKARNIVLMRQ